MSVFCYLNQFLVHFSSPQLKLKVRHRNTRGWWSNWLTTSEIEHSWSPFNSRSSELQIIVESQFCSKLLYTRLFVLLQFKACSKTTLIIMHWYGAAAGQEMLYSLAPMANKWRRKSPSIGTRLSWCVGCYLHLAHITLNRSSGVLLVGWYYSAPTLL